MKLARQNDQYAYTRTDTRAFTMWACVEEIQVSNLVNKQAFEKSLSMWGGIQERLTFNLNLLSTPERLQRQLCGCCVVYVGTHHTDWIELTVFYDGSTPMRDGLLILSNA